MIVGALLARNEAGADRYLKRALDNAKEMCDVIVVVDDDSTDDTADVCAKEGCLVTRFSEATSIKGGEGFWGSDETARRALLWQEACSAAQGGGWIYFFDADHELVGIDRDTLHGLTRSRLVNAWAFPLYDCWDSEMQMRVDGFWQAHTSPRPWLVLSMPEVSWDNLPRGIHTGHIPPNYPLKAAVAPYPAAIRHLGYVSESHRKAKAARYLALR